MSYRLGIDVGGTFTDFLLVGDDDFRLVHKTSSTPSRRMPAIIPSEWSCGVDGVFSSTTVPVDSS